MPTQSKIEWTNSTWNPLTGCTKISSGCANCYAERMALRLQSMGNSRYKNGFNLSLHTDLLSRPLTWKKPRFIFVNSMSDLFHKDVPLKFILDVFATMNKAPQHIFQVLTKRSHRLIEVSPQLPWADNIWMGVTVEDSDNTHRIKNLLQTEANIKYVSFEPLIGSVGHITLKGIDWAIVGGESGPGARSMETLWVSEINEICARDSVPFFFKQWGGTNKKKTGRVFQGEYWNNMPPVPPVFQLNTTT